jgi:hypothetical protein
VTTEQDRHRVAVIRVEVRSPQPDGLLIELLEVGHPPGADRLLGFTTSARGLCQLIERWLDSVVADCPPSHPM